MRITDPGLVRVQFLDTAPANLAAPTITELDAGVDLVGDTDLGEGIFEMNGFDENVATIPTPDLRSQSIPTIGGDTTYPDSSISYYKDDTDETIYTSQAKGEVGWICICHDGIATGKRVDVWPVTVLKRSSPVVRDGAKKFMCTYSHGTPSLDGEIAAGA